MDLAQVIFVKAEENNIEIGTWNPSEISNEKVQSIQKKKFLGGIELRDQFLLIDAWVR